MARVKSTMCKEILSCCGWLLQAKTGAPQGGEERKRDGGDSNREFTVSMPSV